MTHPDPERDERELKALFDATSAAPDGMQLTKLRARAADVPSRKRAWRWQLFAPFVALGAGAAAVLLLRSGPEPAPVARVDPPALATTPAPAVAAAPEASAEPRLPEDVDENGPVADLGYADEGLGIDELSGPADDEEDLDVWLDATGAFLEDG